MKQPLQQLQQLIYGSFQVCYVLGAFIST